MSFNQRLGLQPGSDGASIELEAGDQHLVAPDTVHFAVLATLGEVAAAQAVGLGVVPVAVSLQLMRRARPGKLVARGRKHKAGRSMAFADGEVFQNDQLVARVNVTFALV